MTYKKKLKSGFTTGTAAAAATKGALLLLLDGRAADDVRVRLLTGDHIRIPVHTCTRIDQETARCSVIKDAGDDPDITHKAEIGATVRLGDCLISSGGSSEVIISGGHGVGRVTKPGLDIPPGEPAINPGPREMITQAVEDVLQQHGIHRTVFSEVSVTDGEILAKKTLNARLGILGGISILGTTGIVRPLSHDAYIATIRAALSVAKAAGADTAILTTGRRSERFSQMRWKNHPQEAFVQIGDFFKLSLETVSQHRFQRAVIAVFFGKAVKMALGIPHTHAAKSPMTLKRLAQWARDVTAENALAEKIAAANTARHALDYILPDYPQVVTRVGNNIVRSASAFAGPHVHIRAVIYAFDGQIIFDSGGRD
ncbi:cobalt-precorrin-5B (C(1))-methyltransferase CbiD [Desulfococcaceae bacterium HSG9]|nr:cobalt-precorrin-5B (C(1))-methyltransferase CbiD [Desulfococcaceae bacterium HSG9]